MKIKRAINASAWGLRRDSYAGSVIEHAGWVRLACVIAVLAAVASAGIVWGTSPSSGGGAQAQAQGVHGSPGGVVPGGSTGAGAGGAGNAGAGGSTGAGGDTPGRNVGTVPGAGGGGGGNPVPAADIVAPNRIEIPKIKADAPIVDVGTTSDNELDVPLNPHTVGWWRGGAKPGAEVGTAILAGHINYAGVTGSMAAIGTLDPGDEVDVFGKQNALAMHKVRFRVTGVRTYHKTHLPYRQIFDQGSVGRLAIVTCGGPFDAQTGNYLDNIVVFAVPVQAG